MMTGLDERIARIYGIDLPPEISLLIFIALAGIAGFIAGYNWYRIFKAK